MKAFVFVSLFVMLCLCLFVDLVECADFHATNRPSVDFASGGITNSQHWTLTGIYPLKFAEGYAGIQWLHLSQEEEESSTATHIKARIEGGHHWKHVGIRGYARYGRDSVMIERGVWHGGAYLHFDIIKTDNLNINTGLGTWIESEELFEIWQEEEPVENTGLDFGPRAHLQVKFKGLSLLGEYLPYDSFKEYNLRGLWSLEIPVTKMLGQGQIGIVLNGGIDYRSDSHELQVGPLGWHWANTLRWSF